MNSVSSNIENGFEIAIIGMSCRFPGAKNIDEFWENLHSGTESISCFSDAELRDTGVDDETLNKPNYVKAAPILDNPELFDASFFGYSPREAQIMDPQHRFFLECSWEALEHSGNAPDKYNGLIGIYGGTSINTYLFCNGLIPQYFTDPLPILISNDKDFLTTRVSYKLNLTGPSVNVQCGCSTSLVAVHIACQSLLNYECDMALAGGVTIRIPHKTGYLYQEGGIASPDGHCRAFDAKAQGTIFGSGVGVVVLKRLADAVADGDCIHAVIKGSAINNDGSSKVDYTAPSVNSQSKVVLAALANSSTAAETISYIETHGTGTSLGDPIEILALTNAFRSSTDKKGFCAVGSVKTNIGHLDTAAGIASLIKTVLSLKHKQIPPSLHFEKVNPKIDFDNSPFYVNSTLAEWNPRSYPRRAGINSLGIGGTNVHIILEEPPEEESSGPSRSWQLLCLSGKTKSALETATANLRRHLKKTANINIADVAHTLHVGRKAFARRQMIVCQDIDEAIDRLTTIDTKLVGNSLLEATGRDVVFMFSGQGSQYVNMGLDLYKTEPVFRKYFDHCEEILRFHLSLDLRDIIYPSKENAAEVAHKLKQTSITQPALFTIEYALAKLWMEWGILPAALIGHSIGEYVAACLAGVFSLEEALSLVVARGRLMQKLPSGSMLAVFLSGEEILPFLNKRISVASFNSPTICTVSGTKEDIENLEKKLLSKKINYSPLHTSHAFHSDMMEPILESFTKEVSQIQLNPPQIPYISNVTGTWISAKEATTPAYWAKHLRQAVRFSNGIQELLKEPNRILLEVGPGNTLYSLAKQNVDDPKNQIVLSSIRHPKEKKPDMEFILKSLGKLWLSGIDVDWTNFYKDENRHRIPLPTYPFERKRHWIDLKKQPQPLSTKDRCLTDKIGKDSPSEQKCSEYRIDYTLEERVKNEPEQLLITIWQELLGIDQIRISDNFFDLGGTSLIAVHLFAKIEELFGKKLPLATLYEFPTIEKLYTLLKDEQHTISWNSLVTIQPKGSKPPLFFMHSEGGNVLEYYLLSRHLGTDQPFYAMQAQGLEEETTHSTIEEMASTYIKAIKQVQNKGPYLLGGYCLGGLIAYEAAQQLLKQGEKISFLSLIATVNPTLLNNTLDYSAKIQRLFYQLIERIELEKNNLSVLTFKPKVAYLMNRVHKVTTNFQVKIEEHLIDKLQTKFGMQRTKKSLAYKLAILSEAHKKAFFDYKPCELDCDIILFRASKQSRIISSNPTLGFAKIVKGKIKTIDIDAFHKNILLDPQVEILAKRITTELSEL